MSQITKPIILDETGQAISTAIQALNNSDYVKTFAKSLEVSLDSSTYVITLLLKDYDGHILSTQTVDLPLEVSVVGGSYDNSTKTITLTTRGGQSIAIAIGSVIDGLQAEITVSNKLSSDLVDDTGHDHKFASQAQLDLINSLQFTPVEIDED